VSAAAAVTVVVVPPWTAEDQEALEAAEAARRASRLPRPFRRPAARRVCRRREVSSATMDRLHLSGAGLAELRRQVRSGETTISAAARSLGCSRSTLSRVLGGTYLAQ
jgi:AraC-like DNA-binding protein